jgi:hypothetical protein
MPFDSEKKNVKDEQLPDGLNTLVNQLRYEWFITLSHTCE